MLKLDFTLVTTEERADLVNQFFHKNPNYIPRQHELITVTNYILYGKNPYINKAGIYDPELPPEKWTNMTARKEIEIVTKHKTWNRRTPSSLDEVLENPSFNENILLNPPVQIKQTKPQFERAQEADIPTIKELWETIDYCANYLKQPNLSTTNKYLYTHMLIEYRREQYALRDIFKTHHQNSQSANRSTYIPSPTQFEMEYDSPFSQCAFAPMGLYRSEKDLRFEDPFALTNTIDDWGYNKDAALIIDLTKPENIDTLIKFYAELHTYAQDHIDSSQNDIVRTIDFYINNTKFTPAQMEIVQLKKRQTTNQAIVGIVNEKYNKSYRANYISTIYQKACIKIAETVTHKFNCYYERINPLLFKECSSCGRNLLRSPEEFTRKARNSDGFSSKCKSCES